MQINRINKSEVSMKTTNNLKKKMPWTHEKKKAREGVRKKKMCNAKKHLQ